MGIQVMLFTILRTVSSPLRLGHSQDLLVIVRISTIILLAERFYTRSSKEVSSTKGVSKIISWLKCFEIPNSLIFWNTLEIWNSLRTWNSLKYRSTLRSWKSLLDSPWLLYDSQRALEFGRNMGTKVFWDSKFNFFNVFIMSEEDSGGSWFILVDLLGKYWRYTGTRNLECCELERTRDFSQRPLRFWRFTGQKELKKFGGSWNWGVLLDLGVGPYLTIPCFLSLVWTLFLLGYFDASSYRHHDTLK
jgi:hypothetical protein